MTDSTEATYWHHNGKYEADAKRLQNLVPDMGKADTVAGEIWRCVSACYYDYFNNGGCNHKTYATSFIAKAKVFRGATDAQKVAFKEVRRVSAKQNYSDFTRFTEGAFELFVDTAIEFIKANPHLETEPNEIDSLEVWYAADKKRKAEARARRWR